LAALPTTVMLPVVAGIVTAAARAPTVMFFGIVTVDTAVTNPLAFTVTTGTAVAEPKEPTLEFTVARVDVPVTFAEPLNDADVQETSPVIPIVRPVVNVAAEPVVFWLSVGNVQFAKLPELGVPSAGVTRVGLVDITTEPVPVIVANALYSGSQSTAVVSVVPIHVQSTVVPGITVATKLPPEELTVKFPVDVFSIEYVTPAASVLVTGRVIVCVVLPVNLC
jgi:hypothetical protein